MEELSLQRILEAFNAPINEEQAWAVCYQCGKHLKSTWESDSTAGCSKIEGLRFVELASDGGIAGIITANDGPDGKRACSQADLVRSLGVVVFQALDYGLGENEEQTLSPSLELLIERMTESRDDDEHDDGDDEGIEHDEEPSHSEELLLDDVLKHCTERVALGLDAATHYKAVCRALVAEANELLTFLDKISGEAKKLHVDVELRDEDRASLEELERSDWARLWLQVMRSLRQGVKLKKVQATEMHPYEFELTPYEMLMDDIRARRFCLNKIMVNGDIPPQTKKDAHSVILDFIRSRPPLHPVKDRKLAERPPRLPDIREQLMNDIRTDHKLRPTPYKKIETRLDEESSPMSARKVIKPDISLLLDNSEDDDDDDEEEEVDGAADDDDDDVFDDKNKVTPSPLSPLTPLSPPPLTPKPSPWNDPVAMDISSGQVSFVPERRHSITICESPTSTEVSPPGSTASQPNGHSQPNGSALNILPDPTRPGVKPSLECLSLTIEEVMHIRSVLTKAELESLLVDPELHELVDKAKVCFRCKKNKFSLFGHWATKCKFCGRSVCSKCFTKMRIPTEHFEHIPVYTLSPSPLTPGSNKFDFILPLEKTGSAPSSPIDKPPIARLGVRPKLRPQSTLCAPTFRPQESTCDSVNNNAAKRRAQLQRSKTVTRPPPPKSLQGPMMNVCKDCKAMIVNVIRASRYSLSASAPKRDRPIIDYPSRKALRNFHLDLKPVYK